MCRIREGFGVGRSPAVQFLEQFAGWMVCGWSLADEVLHKVSDLRHPFGLIEEGLRSHRLGIRPRSVRTS